MSKEILPELENLQPVKQETYAPITTTQLETARQSILRLDQYRLVGGDIIDYSFLRFGRSAKICLENLQNISRQSIYYQIPQFSFHSKQNYPEFRPRLSNLNQKPF